MIRHNDMRSFIDEDAFNLLSCDLLDFFQFGVHPIEVDHSAGTYDVHCIFIEDAGREDMESKLSLLIYNSVACVVATLKTYDHICLLGKIINDSSFSFVSPLETNYTVNGHLFLLIF